MQNWPARIALLTALALALAGPARPDDEDDDYEGHVPGLRAEYRPAGGGSAVVRVEPTPRHDWGGAPPDVRIPSGGFDARWSGAVLIQAPGRYHVRALGDGRPRLTVAGREVVDGAALDLRPGFVPIELVASFEGWPASSGLEWDGPGFGPEPVPARVLFHRPDPADGPDPFERGRRLADRLGCANCHTVLDLPAHPGLGPPLVGSGKEIRPGWLSAWLADPHALRPSTPMPALADPARPEEASDLAAFLRASAPATRPATAELRMALNLSDPARGRLLFQSLGCLGCHSRSGPPGASAAAAPDLAGLGSKRDAAELAGYLARPKPGTPGRHRPDLKLNAEEAAHLAAYLVEGGDPAPAFEGPDGDPARGRALAESRRCAACHEIPGLAAPPADLPLRAGSDPVAGCLADAPSAGRPRFALDAEARAALRAFVDGLPAEPSPSAGETLALDAIARRECLGCHARDGRGGARLGGAVAEALALDPDLNALKGTLTPPDLTAVGDKLRPEYLAKAVRGEAPAARPWLSARMPAFAFEPGEADRIAGYLRTHDLAGAVHGQTDAALPTPEAVERGAALLGREGFGCVSCHVLDGKIPPGGEPETLGPDLALAHRRMDERYFRRWLADPQRILPGTPMPQFAQPVATLPGTLDDQLSDLWRALGSPRLAELASSATRSVLRHEGGRALVVRDMVLVPGLPGGEHTPRGIAIGLENGQNLLFDADRPAWLAAWRGQFLARTKAGRLWEWHPEGPLSWVAPDLRAPVAFLDADGTLVEPEERRERAGSFLGLDFEGTGVTLEYTLHAPKDARATVVEMVEPAGSGWRRRVRVEGVPDGYRPALVERPAGRARVEGGAIVWEAGGARLSVRRVDGVPPRPVPGTAVYAWPMAPDGPGTWSAEVQFDTKAGD